MALLSVTFVLFALNALFSSAPAFHQPSLRRFIRYWP